MAPEPRDVETLVANRGMHKKLTLKDMDYILAHDKKSKAPRQKMASNASTNRQEP